MFQVVSYFSAEYLVVFLPASSILLLQLQLVLPVSAVDLL